MKKIYTLATCDTCRKILDEVKPSQDVEIINIKENNITAKDLDAAAKNLGSYEALFSRKAMKYRELGLAGKDLSEAEIRDLILSEYTFLKRPVAIINKKITTGNTKEAIAALKANLNGK